MNELSQNQAEKAPVALIVIGGMIVGAFTGAALVVVEVVFYALFATIAYGWNSANGNVVFGVIALLVAVPSFVLVTPIIVLLSIPLGILGMGVGVVIGLLWGMLTALVTRLVHPLIVQRVLAALLCAASGATLYTMVGYDIVATLSEWLNAEVWVADINYAVSVVVGLWFGYSFPQLLHAHHPDDDIQSSIREIGATVLTPVLSILELMGRRRKKRKYTAIHADPLAYIRELEDALQDPNPYVVYRNVMYPRQDLETLLQEANEWHQRWSGETPIPPSDSTN